MLAGIADFRTQFLERQWELVAPAVIQTLSVGELSQLLPTVDAWIAGDDPVNREVLAAGCAGRLRAVVKWGVGVDNVDFNAARELAIPVANTPGMFGAEVADLAVSYVAALARETFDIDREVRRGGWPKPQGISLAGKLAALVGYGDIGRSVARRLLAADMRIVVFDPAIAEPLSQGGVESSQWPARVDEAQFLVFTCALTSKNRHMLNANVLSKVKSIRVVNVARGPLIDEAALVAALKAGRVHSAALDVFEVEPLPRDSPLRDCGRCIFGSHNGSNTVDAVRRTSLRALELLDGMLLPPAE
jgi:D-3-phosphoglycerate dehydrogenase